MDIFLLVFFVVGFVLATFGFGVARIIDTNDDSSIPASAKWQVSRTRAKRYFRARGLRLVAGQLAQLMGDAAWLPGVARVKFGFAAVPSVGRPWATERRRSVRRNPSVGQKRAATNTRAVVWAKMARDRAARVARQARKAVRSTNRSLPKGVWAARLREERTAQLIALTVIRPSQPRWLINVQRAERPEQLLAVARFSSVSRWHDAADSYEEAKLKLVAAKLPFERGQARAQLDWAGKKLRQELLAA